MNQWTKFSENIENSDNTDQTTEQLRKNDTYFILRYRFAIVMSVAGNDQKPYVITKSYGDASCILNLLNTYFRQLACTVKKQIIDYKFLLQSNIEISFETLVLCKHWMKAFLRQHFYFYAAVYSCEYFVKMQVQVRVGYKVSAVERLGDCCQWGPSSVLWVALIGKNQATAS